MREKEYVIGVDIGTGSTKAVMVDAERNVIAKSQSYYDTNSPEAGYSEQDPEVIWTAFVKCIREVIEKTNHLAVSVSLSSVMHGLLVVDNKNEKITPLITWEDTRSENIANTLRKSKEGKNIYMATGAPVHSMLPLCKIKWLKENEKEIFKKAYKFVSIKEFIWFRLFGQYEIDYSIASATGLFSIEHFKWHEPSLKFCGIKKSRLSKPVSTDFIRKNVHKEIAKSLGISPETMFCIGASDGCLANLGSDATGEGIAAVTIGTSGAVRIACPKPIRNYTAMIFNYILDDATFISGGPVNNGGNVLKWMFKTFLNNSSPSDDDYKKIFKTIEKIPAGSNGLIFLPYIYGERAPVWDEKASGIFLGIQSFHTNAHFFRAALEGICFTLKNILELIETSAKVKQLNASGGFVHSGTWIQILADISGKKVYLVQSADASSVGAALLGMKAAKIIKDYTLLSQSSGDTTYPDKKTHDAYEKYYAIFKNLYKPMSKYMHQLHKLNQ